MPTELISIREFSRRIGTNEKQIRRAIQNGQIVKGVVNGKINPVVATREYESCGLGQKRKAQPEQVKTVQKPKQPTEPNYPPDFDPNDVPKPIGKDSQYSDVNLYEKFYKAMAQKMDYEVAMGKLVERDVIKMELFAQGAEIRDAFQLIPDRITDDLIAASSDRNKFHNILYSAIEEVLIKLSNND